MKYKLTDEAIKHNNRTLYRIQALKDFSDVKAGELGGWIESERNLSQDGDCWVADKAKVFDTARISGNARVSDNAWVFGDAQVYNNARVFDNAQVYGNAEVHDEAKVFGNAEVYKNAQVFDNAEIKNGSIIG